MVVFLYLTFDLPSSLPFKVTGISFILKPTAFALEIISGFISVPSESNSIESNTSFL